MNQFCARTLAIIFIVALAPVGTVGLARGQQRSAPAAVTSATNPPAATAETPDAVVLKVGDKQYTKAEMDALIRSLPAQAQQAIATQPQARKQFGDQYAQVVALARQAEVQHLDQTPDFNRRLTLLKQQLEAQLVYDQINQQAKVNSEEVQQYYNTHSADYDEIMLRQIVVRKKVEPQGGGAGTQSSVGLSPEDAKSRAAAIRDALKGGADVKKVIEDFKPPEVVIDSEARKVRRGGMRPEMEKVAFALKDGEVSDAVDLPQAVIMFQVTAHSHSELQTVAPEIEKKLRQQKIEAAVNNVKKSSGLWLDEKYFSTPAKAPDAPTLVTP